MKTLDIIKLALEILGPLGAVKLLQVWVKRLYNHWKKNREAAAKANAEVLTGLLVSVKEIRGQVFSNGGSSMLDKLDRILDNQVILKEVQEAALYLDSTPTVKSDMNGICTFVNLAYLKLSGFHDADEAMGEGALRSVHPDDREEVKKQFISALKTGTQFVSTYRKINVSTGEVFKVMAMTKIIKNSKGHPVEVIGVIKVLEK